MTFLAAVSDLNFLASLLLFLPLLVLASDLDPLTLYNNAYIRYLSELNHMHRFIGPDAFKKKAWCVYIPFLHRVMCTGEVNSAMLGMRSSEA